MSPETHHLKLHLFVLAGLASGLFVGFLIGLSRSPVVGTAITAALPIAAWVTSAMSAKEPNAARLTHASLLYVSTFFLAALVAVGAGMLLRLSKGPVEALYGELLAVKVSEKDAREAVSKWVASGKVSASDVLVPTLFSKQEESRGTDPIDECDAFPLGSAPYSTTTIEQMARASHSRLKDAAAILKALPSSGTSDKDTLALHLKVRRLACELTP